MDSFELPTNNFDPTALRTPGRKRPLQPDDDIADMLDDITAPTNIVTPDDELPQPSTRQQRKTSQRQRPHTASPDPAKTRPDDTRQQETTSQTTPNRPASGNHTKTQNTTTHEQTRISMPTISLSKIFADSRFAIFLGVVLILTAAYMLVASISYIANAASDQSALVNTSVDIIRQRASNIDNTTGWFGAMLSHFLIYRWLGVGSFILIFYVSALGLSLVKLCRFNFWSLTFKSLVSAISVSLIAGLVTYSTPSPTFWGGEHGHYINKFLIDNASMWGAIAVDTSMLTALVLIFIRPISYIVTHAAKILKNFKAQMAQKHNASIEAARRSEARMQAERAANAKQQAAKHKTTVTTDADIKTEHAPASETMHENKQPDTPPVQNPKPAPLDEIYTPLHPSPAIVHELSAPANDISEASSTNDGADSQHQSEYVSETEHPVADTDDVYSTDLNTIPYSGPEHAHNTETSASTGLDDIYDTKNDATIESDAPTASAGTPLPALAPVTLSLNAGIHDSISLDVASDSYSDLAESPAPETYTETETTRETETAVTESSSPALTGSMPLTVNETAPIELLPTGPELDSNSYDPTAELSHFRFPGLDLLKQIDYSSTPVDEEEQEANKERIINILRSYGVEISSITATIGPTITLYEIVPAPGVRISKIKRLGDDVALNLAAMGIRIIAPIPGKGTIGMEVPNKTPRIVSIHSILASRAYRESKAQLPIALGTTISNEVYVTDLAKMPHLLVAGATGMGKSVGLNTIIASLLYRKHPAELKFIMVDPKRVEFSLYKCIEKHYLAKLPDEENAIITEPENVVTTLNSLCQEMEDRYKLLSSAGMRGIKEYNEKFVSRRLNPEKGHRFLPYIVVVIDEFADIILTVGRDVESPISRLAAKARAIGIHVILATQRPSVNVITGVIKANFPGRIAFRVTQRNDSQTILDRPGAEQLIGRGDMLISRDGIIERVQCAFIDTPEVEDICNFIASQQGYTSAYELPEISTTGDSSASGTLTDRDSLFAEAGREVISQGVGSTSSLQRKFNIGYPRAGKIMDQLEMAGVVGPTQGAKPRAVLMDMYAFERFLET